VLRQVVRPLPNYFYLHREAPIKPLCASLRNLHLMAHTADTQITRPRLDVLTVLLRKTAYSSLVYLTASVQVHDALAMQPRQTNWIQLTRVKAEKNLDDEVVQWTWVLNAQNEWSESALSTAGHGVGSWHVQRAEHWTHSHIILQSLTMLNHLFVIQWCCHYTNS